MSSKGDNSRISGRIDDPSIQSEDARFVSLLKAIISMLAVTSTVLTVSEIALTTKKDDERPSTTIMKNDTGGVLDHTIKNPCANKNPQLQSVLCIADEMEMAGEQSGVNVTKGYQGQRSTDAVPITLPFSKAGLCPVNVHWHLGAEHYSVGEYDENGSGPVMFDVLHRQNNQMSRRGGIQCNLYDETEPIFTTPYQWKHCKDMEVGQTYEVHWPHSSAGACGTKWQYQTPYIDGVFCTDGVISLGSSTAAFQIGVQAQVFTIVNDESYYNGDLFNGMLFDKRLEAGIDVAYYTGSTTGTTFSNEICSAYSPITWQVDRKCHLVSASSFDKMCMEMKAQADDMEADLVAHASRELVNDKLAANNQH